MKSIAQLLAGLIAIVGAGVILYQLIGLSDVIVTLWPNYSAKDVAVGGFVLVFAFSAIICGVFTALVGFRGIRKR